MSRRIQKSADASPTAASNAQPSRHNTPTLARCFLRANSMFYRLAQNVFWIQSMLAAVPANSTHFASVSLTFQFRRTRSGIVQNDCRDRMPKCLAGSSTTHLKRRRRHSVVAPMANPGSRIDNDSSEETSTRASFRYHELTNVHRVYCLSDLHTDHSANLQWLRDRMASSPKLGSTDLILVAGDISHDIVRFAETLQILRDQCQVFFVPGNHEAWSDPILQLPTTSTVTDRFESMPSVAQSKKRLTVLEKLAQCQQVCRDLGVFVDPVYLKGGKYPLWILPLGAWYDGSLSFSEELCEGFENWPWADFRRCYWGPDFPELPSPNDRIPEGLTEFFLDQNRREILKPWQDFLNTDSSTENSGTHAERPAVISVSHFAPNQQCLPDWKDLQSPTFQTDQWLDHGAGTMSAKFAKVAGSSLLDEQIRGMAVVPRIHIFGHSHRPKDFMYKGIRYIHNPLGKPRERELRMVSPNVDFQYIWNVLGDSETVDALGGQIPGKAIIR